MKEKIHGVITFMENHVIECRLNAGCGRCDEARQHVAALKEVLKDVDAEVDRRIKERMPSEKTIDLWWKDFQWGLAAPDEYLEGLEAGFRGGIKYTFSRLSQKTDNLKENNNNGSTN